jgi:phage-related protein
VNERAVQAAALGLKLAQEQIGKLPASEQAAVKGIQGLSAEFGKISRAFAPTAFKVFADGLKVVGNLLPHLTQFAAPFAAALDGLMQKLAKFTASKGFSDWLKQFSKDVGPAVTAIGEGIGKVAIAFGKLMTVMSSKDVAHAINIAFGAIAGTINVVTFAIRRFMQNWDGMSAAAAKAGHAIAGAFKSTISSAVGFQNAIDHAFMAVVHGAASMVSGVIHFVSSLPGKIQGFFAGAGGWLLQAGKNIIEGLIHGIESMIGAVGSAISSIASKIRSFLPFSPAKEGPLSGGGSPDLAGRQIARMLAQGLDYGRPGVAQAAGRLAGAAAGMAGMAGAYGRGGGGAQYTINLNGVIDKAGAAREIHQLMLEHKRNNGRLPLGLG